MCAGGEFSFNISREKETVSRYSLRFSFSHRIRWNFTHSYSAEFVDGL